MDKEEKLYSLFMILQCKLCCKNFWNFSIVELAYKELSQKGNKSLAFQQNKMYTSATSWGENCKKTLFFCSSFEIPVEHEKLQLRRRLLHTIIIATCLKKK